MTPDPRAGWPRLATAAGNPDHAWAWTVLVAPALLFPQQVPYAWGLAAVLTAVPLACARYTHQRIWPDTPLTLPSIALVVMVGVGAFVSPVPAVSEPKVAGVLLGLLLFRSLMLGLRARDRFHAAVILYLSLGVLLSVAGLFGAVLNNKYLPASVTDLFSPQFRDVPGTGGFVNPNALGGTTLYFFPLLSTLAFGRTRFLPAPHWLSRLFLSAALAVLCGILVLSQSLTAWASAAATLVAIAVVRYRAVAIATGVLILTMLVAAISAPRLLVSGLQRLSAPSVNLPDGTVDMTDRLELWSRALLAIQDAPFTGIGLNAFRSVVPVAYPLFEVSPDHDVDIAHAHNVFLQTALDAGIPGLVAYLALLFLSSGLCWRIARQSGTDAAVSLGLWGGLLATHLFGLLDAVALGAKVGLFFWWNLGLIGALFALQMARSPAIGHQGPG